MKHFALEDWADFMREVVEPLQRAAMQRHLDEGCKRCLRAVAVWQSVLDVARQEANNQPPKSAVRRSEEHTSELQSRLHLVCRLLLEKKKKKTKRNNRL